LLESKNKLFFIKKKFKKYVNINNIIKM